MDKIAEYRRRLAALSIEGVGGDFSSPAKRLADCRSLEGRLRELKRQVLGQIASLRGEAQERAKASLKPRPSLREAWERRQEGAKRLLADVHQRVIGLVDGKHDDAARAWGQINQEIDQRLARLAELETRLTGVVGEATGAGRVATRRRKTAAEDTADDDLYAAVGAEACPPEAKAETEDTAEDDLYAAVGAEARKGQPRAAYCRHCGQGLEADDRYCRRCGHRLA